MLGNRTQVEEAPAVPRQTCQTSIPSRGYCPCDVRYQSEERPTEVPLVVEVSEEVVQAAAVAEEAEEVAAAPRRP